MLVWIGLPIVVPFVKPGREPHTDYLTTGLFPVNDPGTNAAPPELFKQLEKENLVYYAWEITGARLAQWRPLWQMSRFLRDRPIPTSSAPSEKWLLAISPKLENTITEAILEGPRSLKIVRQSQLGFNALELVLLAHMADRYDTPATAQTPSATGSKPKPRPAPRRNSPPPLNPPQQNSGDQ